MIVAFATLGCKVNQYETEALKELFHDNGFEIASEGEAGDICIVNTCSVTNIADRKSRQAIRKFKKLNPKSIIAVTGCYAQTGAEIINGMPEVDIIAGTNEKSRLPELINEYIKNREKILQIRNYDRLQDFDEMGTIEAMEGRTRAYIKIQEGCNRFCSYCIIPYARGNVRSRDEENILKEARLLITKGYRELVFTGINTALYGGEEDGEPKLHILLKKINDIEGDFRIRLSSLEPTVINAEYIRKLFDIDKLCHHVHLSVQSGSDIILGAMNRRYNMKEYYEIVDTLKKFDDEYGITTDIIVGFPGETEEDFTKSVLAVEKVDFCKVHVFRYSRRENTPAAKMAGQVLSKIKNERSERLIEASEHSAARFLKSNCGKIRRVLFEEYQDSLKMISGLTDNYIKVYIPIEKEFAYELINSFSEVHLKTYFADGMIGEFIQQKYT